MKQNPRPLSSATISSVKGRTTVPTSIYYRTTPPGRRSTITSRMTTIIHEEASGGARTTHDQEAGLVVSPEEATSPPSARPRRVVQGQCQTHGVYSKRPCKHCIVRNIINTAILVCEDDAIEDDASSKHEEKASSEPTTDPKGKHQRPSSN